MTEDAHIARADASAYYNEIDPYCAAWLQNLMDAGHIPHGVIDTRSIEDVRPDELAGFTQCHFFAGLGGWAYALQLAGWGTRPVWTGSCPCQPFSAAGKGAGFADERHLWPAWQHLIAQCRPTVVFGEQVASKDADPWIDLVHADLEGMGYAFGCVPFPSAGIGAPHIRDRNYWVADTADQRLDGRRSSETRDGRDAPRVEPQRLRDAGGLADASGARSLPGAQAGVHRGEDVTGSRNGEPQRSCAIGRVADALGSGLQRPSWSRDAQEQRTSERGVASRLADADGRNTSAERQQRGGEQRQQPQDGGAGGMANAHCGQQHGLAILRGNECYGAHAGRPESVGGVAACSADGRPGPTNGLWAAADWLECTDGKWRPVEPGTFPLAHGIPGRVGRLRAYGNAIVPQAAQAFIESYCEARGLIALEAAA